LESLQPGKAHSGNPKKKTKQMHQSDLPADVGVSKFVDFRLQRLGL